jgi:hypothetical protein
MIVRSYHEQATLVTTLIPAGRTYENKYDFKNLSLTTSAYILLDRYRSPVMLAAGTQTLAMMGRQSMPTNCPPTRGKHQYRGTLRMCG